jgi:hypothetical protein
MGAVAVYYCGEVALASIWRPVRMKNDYIISCPRECNKGIFSPLFYDEGMPFWAGVLELHYFF